MQIFYGSAEAHLGTLPANGLISKIKCGYPRTALAYYIEYLRVVWWPIAIIDFFS